MKDLYVILGVPPTASQDDIKHAFQELAKRHHPDTSLRREDAGATFREIAAAYEILGDAARRQEYDRSRPWAADDSPTESAGTDRKTRSWRFSGVPPARPAAPREQAPHSATVKVPLRLAAEGGELHVTGLPGGTYVLGVPAGTSAGSIAVVQTPHGPFRVKLVVEDEPPFHLNGDDIDMTLRLNLAEAVLGTRRTFRGPRGTELTIDIPECTPPGTTLRLARQGLGEGDLRVRLELEFPRELSPEARLQFTRFAKKAGLQSKDS
ncbi:MAG: J domain-containing protein [Candidatus Riflebacteria bacterium]|nr:J domain-containing protein [Candidatus Riflebacteria bacterium]